MLLITAHVFNGPSVSGRDKVPQPAVQKRCDILLVILQQQDYLWYLLHDLAQTQVHCAGVLLIAHSHAL